MIVRIFGVLLCLATCSFLIYASFLSPVFSLDLPQKKVKFNLKTLSVYDKKDGIVDVTCEKKVFDELYSCPLLLGNGTVELRVKVDLNKFLVLVDVVSANGSRQLSFTELERALQTCDGDAYLLKNVAYCIVYEKELSWK